MTPWAESSGTVQVMLISVFRKILWFASGWFRAGTTAGLTAAEPPSFQKGFRLRDWRVLPDVGMVRCGGTEKHLEPQQMELLVYLVLNRDRVVPKEELFQVIWRGAQVEEVGLPRCISEIRKVLGDDARAPRFIQTIPKRGYRLIAPVARERAQSERGGWPRRALAAGAALALALGSLAAYSRLRPGGNTGGSASGNRPAVAVLDFDNLSGEPEASWLATALAEMLASELALSKDLRVIPTATVARLTHELSLADAASLTPDTLRRLRTALSVDHLVLGSYLVRRSEEGTLVHLDLQVQETVSGEIVSFLNETVAEAEVLDLVTLSGAGLREVLRAQEIPAASRATARAYLPDDPIAVRFYSEGLRRLRHCEAKAARGLLERSLAKEPGQPLAYLALSEAWAAQGYDSKAAEAASKAFGLVADLPREQALWVEARYLEASSRVDEAVDLYRALWIFAPDNLEYGLYLARAQNRAGRPGEALSTLDEVGNRADRRYQDPRFDLVASESAQLLGHHEEALARARRAADLGSELGAALVVALGRHMEGLALYDLGRVQEAMAALGQAQAGFVAAGDRRREAQVRNTLAGWLEDLGDFARAEEISEAALAIFRDLGDRAGEADVLLRLADFAWGRGERAGGERMFRRATDIYRQIQDRAGEAEASQRLAIAMASAGQLEEAGPLFEQTLTLYRELGNEERAAVAMMNLGKLSLLRAQVGTAAEYLRESEQLLRRLGLERWIATVLYNRGYVDMLSGELAAAEEAFEEAVTLFRRLKNRRMRAASLTGLGEVRAMRGEFEDARAHLEEALALRQEMGEARRIIESYPALIGLLLAQGQLEVAEATARRMEEAARSAGFRRDSALRLLARTLLAQGRAPEAERMIEDAKRLRQADTALTPGEVWLSIVDARVRAASGEAEAAGAELVRVIDQTKARGLWTLQQEAQLTRCVIEMRLGDPEAARASLFALEAEARRRGWAVMARKARAAYTENPHRAGAQSPQPSRRLPAPRSGRTAGSGGRR